GEGETKQAEMRPAPPETPQSVSPPPESIAAPVSVPDDRETLKPGDHVLLIIEDDANFAKIVRDFAHQKGFKCLAAGDGKSGLRLATTYLPAAIILDLNLPLMTGWEVLDALKGDPATRHIPVHIMSVDDEDYAAYQHGALGFLTKPVSPEALEAAFAQLAHFTPDGIKSLLVVEDDANLRHSITKLLAGADVHITEVGAGQTALAELRARPYDCMILDLNLPDMSGFELLNRLREDVTFPHCPVIIYTGRALTEEENAELLKYTDAYARPLHVVVKGAKSPERLLDETALFLHRVVAQMPEDKQQTIRRLHNREAIFADKRILLVDDDARNAFALSKLLTDKGLRVTIARSGQKALEILGETAYHLVLMDIMMPDMDGYEAIHRIRQQPQFRALPILALTAKAMKGDREKCLAAGANDYLPKPVDPERIFSMLRVWLSRE
ncbi:MAG TPA: response regulator, partial [Anaerolineae bacterium]|nr:response regulator [Anaerolineae bacterium]